MDQISSFSLVLSPTFWSSEQLKSTPSVVLTGWTYSPRKIDVRCKLVNLSSTDKLGRSWELFTPIQDVLGLNT